MLLHAACVEHRKIKFSSFFSFLTSICLKESTSLLGAHSAMQTLPVRKELASPANILVISIRICYSVSQHSVCTFLQYLDTRRHATEFEFTAMTIQVRTEKTADACRSLRDPISCWRNPPRVAKSSGGTSSRVAGRFIVRYARHKCGPQKGTRIKDDSELCKPVKVTQNANCSLCSKVSR